ncbi:MAG: hypothetical protein ABIY70_21150 [Capsulimonas sp.]|uniref:hypothetical protein n=1 Tax=Capsulimonas sp. TaxID=2494211 RepID=UPI0032676912
MATTEQQHQHLHEVHEHLRHASTSDSSEEIRERLRRAELALERHERETSGQTTPGARPTAV